MADVKPVLSIFCYITLTDVIIKVTVADLVATFLADVIAIFVWVGNTTLVICYDLILNSATMAITSANKSVNR